MMRWITMLVAAAVLTGCVTTREVVYREPYHGAPGGSHVGGGTYYDPGYAGSGDYYYGSASYGGYAGYGVSYGISYFDYPLYYSLFWPINRWYYDPFVYPGYHYGVTWFPRNYFSINLSYGNSWHRHRWMSYSPYRHSWVDNYYDWRPWYDRYPSYRNHYPKPRFGDARVEAQRLADLRRPARMQPYAQGQYRSGMRGNTRVDRNVAPAYRGNRAADYGNAGALPRQGSSQAVRRVGAGAPRATPQTGVFGNPARAPSTSGMAPRGAVRSTGAVPGPGRTEVQRINQQRGIPVNRNTQVQVRDAAGQKPVTNRSGVTTPVRTTPPAPVDGGIPVRGVRSAQPTTRAPAAAPVRSVSAPQPVPRQAAPVRSSTPVPGSRGYSTGASAPAVRSSPMPVNGAPTRSAPVQAAPTRPAMPSRTVAPARAPAPTPRAAPVESRDSGSSSRSGDSGGVRRTGSNRER